MAEIDIEKLKSDLVDLHIQQNNALTQYHQITGAISALEQLLEKLGSESSPIEKSNDD